MLPQLDWAVQHNKFAAIVLNPNCSTDPRTGDRVRLSESMQNHTLYVYDKFIKDAGFKNLLFIAHSAGGGCMMRLLDKYPQNIMATAKSIAFTDTGPVMKRMVGVDMHKWMEKTAVHYMACNEPLGQIMKASKMTACPHVSAGHSRHEYTTGVAWPEIRKQFDASIGENN